MSGAVVVTAVEGVGEVGAGERIGGLIAAGLGRTGVEPRDGDVIVVSQKVVSKAEGRTRELATVEPGPRARKLAGELGRDPRLVELVLAESRRVVRAAAGVLITETHGGWICANAGIDSSNLPTDELVTLLPLDADVSARRIRAELVAHTGTRPGVLIADSFGRPWRIGQADVAIGCAGINALDDWRGRADAHGRALAATVVAVADELAAAADLARTKTSATPAVHVRGAERWWTAEDGPGAAATLQRPEREDLFR